MPAPERVLERDFDLERALTAAAARGAGYGDDGGLRRVADDRAFPGGVVVRDFDAEAREELADCSSYLLWGCLAIWPLVEAGDAVATKLYGRRMRALQGVIGAWHALNGG